MPEKPATPNPARGLEGESPRPTHHFSHGGILTRPLTGTSVHANDSSRFDVVHGGEESCSNPMPFPFANGLPRLLTHAGSICACTIFGTSSPSPSWRSLPAPIPGLRLLTMATLK